MRHVATRLMGRWVTRPAARAAQRLVAQLAASVAAGLVAACSPGLAVPTRQDAQRAAEGPYPGTSLADLSAGRDIYVAKCSGCHRLFDPTDRSPAAWSDMVGDMRDRSHLTGAQEAAILRYLAVMSESSLQKPANGS